MKHITYLFGAGASHGAIPVVNGLTQGFENFRIKIEENREHIQNLAASFGEPGSGSKIGSLIDSVTKDIDGLVAELHEQSSIDTYARKLYLQRNLKDLTKVKALISLYFTFIQYTSPKDKRYDNFLASITGSYLYELPKNLKILSWNYDFQFELSYSSFSRNYSLEQSKSDLNLYVPSDSIDYDVENRFAMFKLNGSVGYGLQGNFGTNFKYLGNFERGQPAHEVLLHLISAYPDLNKLVDRKFIHGVSFAWERQRKPDYESKMFAAINPTEVLVVVGYSFPFFNRDEDRKILRDNMPNLKKVYFQAPDAHNLRERFLAIREDIPDNCLLLRTDLEQFTFPNEL